jgi:hypothetical protein
MPDGSLNLAKFGESGNHEETSSFLITQRSKLRRRIGSETVYACQCRAMNCNQRPENKRTSNQRAPAATLEANHRILCIGRVLTSCLSDCQVRCQRLPIDLKPTSANGDYRSFQSRMPKDLTYTASVRKVKAKGELETLIQIVFRGIALSFGIELVTL